jgi:hypothetical protein
MVVAPGLPHHDAAWAVRDAARLARPAIDKMEPDSKSIPFLELGSTFFLTEIGHGATVPVCVGA